MYNPLILPDLRVMLEENDTAGMAEFCQVFHPAVAAEILDGLPPADVWKVLDNGPLERQVEIFEFMAPQQQMALVDHIDRPHLSRLIEAMAPDDRADLLGRMDPERVESLLPLMAQAERGDIRKLLSYPEDSAGTIMTTEYASLPEGITVREALERLRKQAPNSETIYYVYILDDDRRLQGMISLRDLILAKLDAKLANLMSRDVISVRVDQDREIAAQELARFDFIALPVVDSQNRLVGIVTHDDVLDVVQEEATEDAHRQGAVAPLEGSYLDTPVRTIIWKRAIWLSFLAAVAVINAEVLSQYQHVSRELIWMISFLPMVLASGGNSGSQSATLVIRTLALGELTRKDNTRLVRRELLVGLSLGACVAVVGFVAAAGFFQIKYGHSDYPAAGVVSVAVMLAVLVGAQIGSVLPLIFKGLGMDPALMSNPLIAALSDVLGVVMYYTVAMLFLRV